MFIGWTRPRRCMTTHVRSMLVADQYWSLEIRFLKLIHKGQDRPRESALNWSTLIGIERYFGSMPGFWSALISIGHWSRESWILEWDSRTTFTFNQPEGPTTFAYKSKSIGRTLILWKKFFHSEVDKVAAFNYCMSQIVTHISIGSGNDTSYTAKISFCLWGKQRKVKNIFSFCVYMQIALDRLLFWYTLSQRNRRGS